MTTDLCPEAAVVHITTTQILTSESVVSVGAEGAEGAEGAGGAGARGGCSAVELGRRLLLAARAGDTPLVLDLMAKGAPFTTDWLGTSPLHLAASNAHTETCGVLLRAGVSRDSRTKVERTPLHLAAYSGHSEVAELLLKHGALVDCRDMLRMTPLHWAAERGHASCCAVLLRRGADARVTNKFLKTPTQLAAARGHHDVLALIDDALKQREAARSVKALVAERSPEETTETQQPVFTTVHTHKVPEIKIKPKQAQEKATKPEIKAENVSPVGESAAALLRRHGIALLPADRGSTLLSALQSGRTVVLSDAGKLMLKESVDSASTSTPTPTVAPAPLTPVSAGTSGSGGGRGRGVVLTATPVRAPPPGVKVFTLNNRLLATPKQTVTRLVRPDTQQVKFVQLPADARVVSPRKLTRARRVTPVASVAASVAASAASAPAATVAAATPRPPVKIIMNKTNFERLVAGARRDTDVLPPGSVLVTSEATSTETLTSVSSSPSVTSAVDTRSLVAQLAAAQRAVASLSQELRDCRARLAHYEPAD